jgi:hypothetical protein
MRLSADGNLLAIGMFADYWDTAASTTPRGSVSLFRRTGTSWKREARFTEAGTFRLGQNLDLDESGNTLAFSVEVSGLGGLRLEIYKHAAAGWTRAAQLDETVHRCVGYALSGDGSTFVRRCVVNGQIRIETFAAPGWTPRDSFVQTPPDPTYGPSMLATDYTGDIIVSSLMQAGLTPASAWNPETDVFRRNAGVYERVAALHPSRYAGKDLRFRNYFGAGLDVSHAGSYIAVVDPDDTLGGLVTSQPTAADANKPQHGAVYVFEKRGTGYALRRHVNLPSQPTWGFNITTQAALALDGKTLVISEPTNFSGSAGIQGDRDDTSAPVSGAFWLF